MKKAPTRRSDAQLAADYEAKAKKLRTRIAVRSDKTLTRMNSLRAGLRWLSEQIDANHAQELAAACTQTDELLGAYVAELANGANPTPQLPGMEDEP